MRKPSKQRSCAKNIFCLSLWGEQDSIRFSRRLKFVFIESKKRDGDKFVCTLDSSFNDECASKIYGKHVSNAVKHFLEDASLMTRFYDFRFSSRDGEGVEKSIN